MAWPASSCWRTLAKNSSFSLMSSVYLSLAFSAFCQPFGVFLSM